MSAGHGFIVTPGHTTALSALTDVTRKWPGRVPDGRLVLRAYAGDAATRELADDAALLAAIRGDVEPLVGLSEPPALALVRRWPDSMPQLGPGHAARVATIEASIAVAAPGIALAGAAYGGVGIPAVAASVPAAVDALLERVRAGAAASS
jgi:oxygen-dependent protoporphyrinogen oxidase